MLVKETSQERYIFNDPAENLQRLIVVMEYVLQGNLEDFIYFLQDLINGSEFVEFEETILKMVEELSVDEEEINSLLKIKLPAS